MASHRSVCIHFINFNQNYSALTVIPHLIDFVKLTESLFSPGMGNCLLVFLKLVSESLFLPGFDWINKHVYRQIRGRAKRSLFSPPCKYLLEAKYSVRNFFSPGTESVAGYWMFEMPKPLLTRMPLKFDCQRTVKPLKSTRKPLLTRILF